MKLIDLQEYLSSRTYPGRCVMLGRSADNQKAVIAYAIMGRSENSRNRIFEPTEDGIRTRAFDESKMTDPSLIIYHPVRRLGTTTIVTNGDQTDTVRDGLAAGKSYIEALRNRQFEPDPDNYTPRISGVLNQDGSFALSILKSSDGDPAGNHRYFYEYDTPKAGEARLIHTYQEDKNPLPSFEGEPIRVAVAAQNAQALADLIWAGLNEQNKVSLYTAFVDLTTGETDSVIVNKHR